MNLQIYKILTLPSVLLAVLRMEYHNIGPLSVNQPVLRMGYPNLALLSVNPAILRIVRMIVAGKVRLVCRCQVSGDV